MKPLTRATFLPFNLFGSAGTGAGAHLLADALAEMLADAKRERQPSRSRSYRGRVRQTELTFDTMLDYRDWRQRGRLSAQASLERGEFLLWVGGNHLSVLPVLEELGPDAVVVQFDAHLDVYNLSDCTAELSHGNFLLHAVGPLPRIVHVGHRDLFLPAKHVARHLPAVYPAEQWHADPEAVLVELRKETATAERVWLDIDCDVFDPAFVPAVESPQPFGLAPADVLRAMAAVWSDRVAGVSLSEFDPSRDRNDQSLGTLVWLLEWVLLRRHERR